MMRLPMMMEKFAKWSALLLILTTGCSTTRERPEPEPEFFVRWKGQRGGLDYEQRHGVLHFKTIIVDRSAGGHIVREQDKVTVSTAYLKIEKENILMFMVTIRNSGDTPMQFGSSDVEAEPRNASEGIVSLFHLRLLQDPLEFRLRLRKDPLEGLVDDRPNEGGTPAPAMGAPPAPAGVAPVQKEHPLAKNDSEPAKKTRWPTTKLLEGIPGVTHLIKLDPERVLPSLLGAGILDKDTETWLWHYAKEPPLRKYAKEEEDPFLIPRRRSQTRVFFFGPPKQINSKLLLRIHTTRATYEFPWP